MVELANAMVLLLLGGMLFFPIVVAPIVFTSLPELEAGQFLRSMFPRYYLFMIFFSALAFGFYQSAAGAEVTIAAAVCLSVALSTLWVRQSLVRVLTMRAMRSWLAMLMLRQNLIEGTGYLSLSTCFS